MENQILKNVSFILDTSSFPEKKTFCFIDILAFSIFDTCMRKNETYMRQ